ncbi:M16 family metallopeptidase [Candidatus Poriferisodalis sp.]|uniref:M16 family metallopeptidase n=1 Tax=Candidatus Poriferisodalis sp. TaxID=3101277 RepID=UPI003B5BE894
MNTTSWRKLFAALFVSVLLAAACAADPPDAVPDEADDEMSEVHEEAPEPEAPAEAEDAEEPSTEAEEEAEPGEEAEPEREPIGDPVDLGEFNDYEPADPDPTLLPVDSNVLIGELSNGLTYYLRSNDSPGEAVVMHLVVNAGGVQDPDGAEGAAHFLEHMLFNGTERFSENELDQVLRDFGTDFGADLNAFTSPDETVYILDFQLDDPEALGLAFTVLSEWASAATILPDDVEEERGIILDEYRLRDESASGRISNFLDAIYYKGTVYEGMLIGGSEESISSVTAAQLREFYETWYRPDNMAVVVVGDLPVTQMEQLVVEHFADWAARTDAAPAQPDRSAFTVEFVTEPVTGVITHPDHGTIYISLDWQLPAWPAGTFGGERLQLMETLITRMLDIRLDAAYRAGLMSQATEPHIGTFAAARGLRLIGTNYQGSDLVQATIDYLAVVEGAAHFGFRPDELDQAVSAFRTSLEFQLESEETRQDGEYAFSYVDHFLSGADISSTADRVNRLGALLGTYSVTELTAHLRWVLDKAPPLVVSIGPDPSQVPTAEELLGAVEAVVPLAPPEAEEAVDVLMEAPDPVTPSRQAALDLFEDAYEWEFPNGARVVFAPSDIAAGEVNVVAEGLGGWSTLSQGDSALARHAVGAVASSGVGDASATQLDEYLATTTARVSPFIAEFSEGFSGATGSDDLEALFTLMHLYITAPRITDVAVNEQVQAMATRLANAETFPRWISQLALLDALYQGSPWYQFIATQAQIDATTTSSLLGLYETRLSDVDDLVVAVVGDIDRATVADLAARYIGTLPSGASDTFVNHRPGFPSGVKRITIAVDADAGAAGFDVMFGAEAPISTESLVIADVTAAVINDLLTVRVREEIGDAYAVGASVSPNDAVGTWEAQISSTGASEGLEAGHAEVIEILNELIADGPTERDLAQAIAVVRDNYVLESNSLIINPLLRRHHLDDADVGTPAQRRQALNEVTADDVQQYAALLFNLDNRIEVFRTSE